MNKQCTSVLLSLGSNIGNKRFHIENAAMLLRDTNILWDIKLSSFYLTEPVGVENQPDFLNAALIGKTYVSIYELLEFCKTIEYYHNRKKKERWAARELDLDIIFFGNSIIKEKDIEIPHPRMQERRFVLVPAFEIAADYLHPVLKKSIKDLLEECTDTALVRVVN
ncbi:MAG TPA: 2-amino-4-hydroxy-6-hydroxymethyldihydropteridine diphosphokinase [Candidatus Kapabacteria bacterium]|nr:2-amino-4-hydroxy-6-hydroxymethyldihydropteridine diphosphokinase [Candidatus Kapabacteria bacterium]HPO62127.1 2-amino-4-hydroxy-6-hydroxymethyldihydropteridine diphosphokinase [Candidatus Kapabacteria bacterium]